MFVNNAKLKHEYILRTTTYIDTVYPTSGVTLETRFETMLCAKKNRMPLRPRVVNSGLVESPVLTAQFFVSFHDLAGPIR
mmetsp:Transcript_6502/g.18634  ORF Transcript_6502/g.18634 Transcript_6502/m.18634 type:complete len:80 (-) Transcript_6502:1315-1554(-)